MTTISPELALVDPELAALGRAALHEPGCFVPASRPFQDRPPAALVPEAQRCAEPVSRRRSRGFVLAGSGALGVGLALAVLGLRLVAPASRASVTPAVARAEAHAGALRDARAAGIYAWSAVPGARAYRVVIRRDTRTVFATTTPTPTVVIPASLRLAPGRYTWTATPSRPDGHIVPEAQPVVEATFVVASRS